MNNDFLLMRILPNGLSIEDEIRRVQNAKVDDVLYVTKTHNIMENQAYQNILDRAGISYKKLTIKDDITYIKM